MFIMRYSTLLVLVAAVAIPKAESESQQSSSESIEDGERIVGGTSIGIASAPYQVGLVSGSSGTGGVFCGGSIIGPNWILTAAHCFSSSDRPGSFMVRAGSALPRSGGQLLRVEAIYRNPSFSSSTFDYDIALLRVSTIAFNANARAVNLPAPSTATNNPPTGTRMFATGFGTLSSGGATPSQLQGVTVLMVDQATCKRTYRQLTERMLCAADTNKDTCQGDSGGPLVNNGIQYGITSFGNGCALAGSPGAYARVSALRNYITQISGI